MTKAHSDSYAALVADRVSLVASLEQGRLAQSRAVTAIRKKIDLTTALITAATPMEISPSAAAAAQATKEAEEAKANRVATVPAEQHALVKKLMSQLEETKRQLEHATVAATGSQVPVAPPPHCRNCHKPHSPATGS